MFVFIRAIAIHELKNFCIAPGTSRLFDIFTEAFRN